MARGQPWPPLVLTLLLLASPMLAGADLAVVRRGASGHRPFCAAYDPSWATLPKAGSGVAHPTTWTVPTNSCSPGQPSGGDLTSSTAVIVNRGGCNFTDKLLAVLAGGVVPAAVLILDVDGSGVVPPLLDASSLPSKHFPVLIVEQAAMDELLEEQGARTVILEQGAGSSINANSTVFLAIALTCIIAGSLWGTAPERAALIRLIKHGPLASSQPQDSSDKEEDESFTLTPLAVLAFVVVASLMLVLMYFLFEYLVYIVIAIFTIATCASTYRVMEALLMRWRRPRVLRVFCVPMYDHAVALFSIAAGLSILWVVCRNKPHAWIIQDILGVGFLITTIPALRIPNLKLATLLLSLFLVYDVFFVFITPLFTEHHDSVMVTAATGGGTSRESLPLVIRMPRFNPAPCEEGDSMLGYGDILIPSLLISYCLRFDYIAAAQQPRAWALRPLAARHSYFVGALVAYLLGLASTFAALLLMDTPQPALLYLVPFTLASVWLQGMVRGHTRALLHGGFDYDSAGTGLGLSVNSGRGLSAEGAAAAKHHPRSSNPNNDSDEEDDPLLGADEA